MDWDPATATTFKQMIHKVPVFLRDIAQKKISQKAERLATEANRALVTEQEMVDAFFAETPFGFHGPMKTDMRELGIDFKKYGYEA